MLGDDNESCLLSGDLRTETDLGEGCVPVGWLLGLMIVKQSLSSWKVEVALVAPQFGLEVKRWLSKKRNESKNV